MTMAEPLQYQQENAVKWELAHMIINTIRQAKGIPLSTEINPYNGKAGKRKKEER